LDSVNETPFAFPEGSAGSSTEFRSKPLVVG